MVGFLVNQRFGSTLALFALTAAGCHSDALESSEGPPPSVVETALVESRLFSERVEVVGEEQRAALREAEANRVLAADVFARTEKLSKVRISAASELTQARAGVAAAEAVVDLARVNLDRTRVRAPFDGALGARTVSPGDWVDSDVALVQIDIAAAVLAARKCNRVGRGGPRGDRPSGRVPR